MPTKHHSSSIFLTNDKTKRKGGEREVAHKSGNDKKFLRVRKKQFADRVLKIRVYKD